MDKCVPAISGGKDGFCQIRGNPLNSQRKIKIKISRNWLILNNLLFHNLALDIEYGFAILMIATLPQGKTWGFFIEKLLHF
ncbi:MAG: hypothetical protein COU42_00040 [Candidatus Nealsonbacteria bacterium CG10_big_fil_rev_8_21_14_0_10_36_24]|uniref:Uncharacterized protein n=2 Tax=Candidatus Nealsoniibacteriota TaxID=1817911 RepID=A0A2H0YP30_9BACT|nr:MAG: hypothetical protein COU42_00040 [Candidatus Nealsonbacteria bacterium CG10_big_fil_rev_8_21_14_0_10_36_24]PIS40029.1 MAG: hypothetical protein COT32_01975 [Candidatus Nealsonbacteria bacterium CG08_land_8_20_14_0_20_36_22]